MIIGDRLRELREEKKLSQGDIEKRTRAAALLHLAGRERAHASGHRDIGEVSASLGSAPLPVFL